LQIKTKIVSCHTADSKPVKQEVNGTVILPPLVFPALTVAVLITAVESLMVKVPGGSAPSLIIFLLVKKLICPSFFSWTGDGETLTVLGVANAGLLDEDTAIGSSSDPERSSVSGGPRDCDSELEDEERGGGGGSAGDGSALPDESGSSPSASSLFIKRTVDEVTIPWIRFTIVNYFFVIG
jgi:hypothetical protein